MRTIYQHGLMGKGAMVALLLSATLTGAAQQSVSRTVQNAPARLKVLDQAGPAFLSQSALADQIQKSEFQINPDNVYIDGVNRKGQRYKAEATIPDEDLFNEDFSKWTGGSIEEPIDTRTVDGFYVNPSVSEDISADYLSGEGWWGSGLYFIGDGLCGFAGTTGGALTTPAGVYTGVLTISFKIKSLPSCTDPYITYASTVGKSENGLAILGGGFLSCVADGEWHDVLYMVENTYSGEDAFIQILTYTPIAIDDFKVVVSTTFLAEPILLPATDYTETGFTANWKPVKYAEDYLLSCYTVRTLGNPGEGTVTDELFNDVELDGTTIVGGLDGWTLSLGETDHVILDPTYEGSKCALVFNEPTDYFETPDNGGIIKDITFKMNLVSGAVDGQCPAQLHIEGWNGSEWKNLGYFQSKASKAGTWLDGSLLPPDLNKYYKYRISALKFEQADAPMQWAFDNFHIETTTPTKREYVCEKLPVAGTSYAFTDLDPEADYIYNVQARNLEYELYSAEPSKIMEAFGVAAPQALEATDIDRRGGYTANWTTVPKATDYEVTNYEVYTASEPTPDYVVLDEQFNKTLDIPELQDNQGVYFQNMEMMKLDDFADRPEWYGYLCGVFSGGVAGIGIAELGVPGEIQSPQLSLGNNGGKYLLSFTVSGTAGERLNVFNLGGRGVQAVLTEEPKTYSQIEMEGGLEEDILVFTSQNGGTFMIYDVKVEQDLAEGDQVFTQRELPMTGLVDNYRFSDLSREENITYAYEVRAFYQKDSKATWSDPSERIFVDLNPVDGIDAVETDGESIQVIAGEGFIDVLSGEAANLTVCNVAGQVVYRSSCPAGRTTVKVADPGLYIVKVSDHSFKVIVK